jgi:hypothetical protein
MPGFDRESFPLPERFDLKVLRRQPQAAAALFASADSQVSDCCLHHEALL